MFITIVLSVFITITLYVFFRGWRLIPDPSWWRWLYAGAFIILAPTYLLAKFFHRIISPLLFDILTWIGSVWLGFFIYVFFLVLLNDILLLLIFLLRIHPGSLTGLTAQRGIGLGILTISCLLTMIGFINANTLRVRTLSLELPRKSGNISTMTIVMASDIHLGTIMNLKRLQKIVRRINDLDPDLILLVGDIIDGDMLPVLAKDLAAPLAGLKARLGIFAVTGNHEYIAGYRTSVPYLSSHGVRFLQDEVTKIADAFYLAGRKDYMAARFGGEGRQSLASILTACDRELPVILMDHEPYRLEEAAAAGVDLQLSGHTHRGQIFPISLITRRVYEIDYGYLRKGATQYYVTSGAGYWGPPIRIGSVSEIVKLVISFNPNIPG